MYFKKTNKMYKIDIFFMEEQINLLEKYEQKISRRINSGLDADKAFNEFINK